MSRPVRPRPSFQPDMRFLSRFIEAVEKDPRFTSKEKQTVISHGNALVGLLAAKLSSPSDSTESDD